MKSTVLLPIGALAAASMLAAPARAQTAFPRTAAGTLAAEALAAINNPDTGAITRFLHARHALDADEPRASLEALLRGLRQQGGGVEPGAVRMIGRSAEVVAWARDVDSAGVQLRIFLARGDSTRVSGIYLERPVRRGGEMRPFPAERMDDARMVRLLGEQVRRLADADQFSGSVLVARGDSVLFEAAVGVANPATGERVTPATRFTLASMSKMFTAVAIARLVDAGRLSLDDSLGALLPGQPWSEQARGATVRQLLSHAAGFGSLFDRPRYDRDRRYGSATELLPVFAGEPLLFAPGAGVSYSNEGFTVLAAIVERITGTSFTDHVRDSVLLPLGMRPTLYQPSADSTIDRALSLPHQGGDLFGLRPREVKNHGWSGGGAGGGHASARDVLRFARALSTGRLVSPALLDTLTQRRNGVGGGYGYGFFSREVNGRRVFGHSGGGPRGWAICTDMDVFADGSYTVIVLSNYDAPFCTALKEAITEMLARN